MAVRHTGSLICKTSASTTHSNMSIGCHCWKFIVLCTFVVFHLSTNTKYHSLVLVNGEKDGSNSNRSSNIRNNDNVNANVNIITEGLIRGAAIIEQHANVNDDNDDDDDDDDDEDDEIKNDNDDDGDDVHHRSDNDMNPINAPIMSISNMTCDYFQQPLNHFVPRGNSPTYMERYCIYDGYTNVATDTTTNTTNSDGTSTPTSTTPIFFYTGNESPIEEYINHTGLMWELAPTFHARIVFVEHRYEGKSVPYFTSENTTQCLSYVSTIQALADYAKIIEEKLNPGNIAPLIVFGGSYGGMLSAWMRMKYPHLVAGAIAASAPIGAFPQSANKKIGSSHAVVANGIDQSYPPTKSRKNKNKKNKNKKKQQEQEQLPVLQQKDQDQSQQRQSIRRDVSSLATASLLESASASTSSSNMEYDHDVQDNTDDDDDDTEIENHCRTNLLAAWPLITWLARKEENNRFLQTSFSLCDPLVQPSDADTEPATPLLEWAQIIWFNLAEGSFPYPSSYIPFALLHKQIPLPAWPLQDACWKSSLLHKDWNVRFHTDNDEGSSLASIEDVRYQIEYGDSGIKLDVDWDTVKLVVDVDVDGDGDGDNDSSNNHSIEESNDIVGLLTSVRDAVSIWYNITKDVTCYNISDVAPNKTTKMRRMSNTKMKTKTTAPVSGAKPSSVFVPTTTTGVVNDPVEVCQKTIAEGGSWGPLCCNDELNLVITAAQGLGHDFFWPPSFPRNVRTYRDIIKNKTSQYHQPCPDPEGIYGYSQEPSDGLSMWLETYYGGISMRGHSNILFSNGLLDPWSAGGVYKDNTAPNNNNNNKGLLWGSLLSSSEGTTFRSTDTNTDTDRAIIQNITNTDIVALIIPFGGHHTDLMYSRNDDPDCVTEARKIEKEFIARWIQNWVPV